MQLSKTRSSPQDEQQDDYQMQLEQFQKLPVQQQQMMQLQWQMQQLHVQAAARFQMGLQPTEDMYAEQARILQTYNTIQAEFMRMVCSLYFEVLSNDSKDHTRGMVMSCVVMSCGLGRRTAHARARLHTGTRTSAHLHTPPDSQPFMKCVQEKKRTHCRQPKMADMHVYM